MDRNSDKYKRGDVEKNIKQLLVYALRSVSASLSFRRNLLLRLKQELSRLTNNVSQQPTVHPGLEENVSRLMASTTTQIRAVPSFRDRLRYQLIAEAEKEQQKRRWIRLAPALAIVVAIVVLIGMVIYPNFWAGSSISVTATVKQGTGVATKTKPWFFAWGTRVVQYNLISGDTILLAEGDRIATGPDAAIVIALFNESRVKLYPSSDLVISELKAIDAKDSYLVRLKLDAGQAISTINHINYGLETPLAAASVLGTDFRMEAITSDHTYLATNEGVVQLTMEGNVVQVPAGEEVQAIRGQPLVVTSQKPPTISITVDALGTTIVWPLIVTSQSAPPVTIEQPARTEASQLTLLGRTDPEATLTINGDRLPVDIDGMFFTTMGLKSGANEITITATSRTGKTTSFNVVLTLPETR